MVLLGARLQTFSQAAIQPGEGAYRVLRLRLFVSYLISAVLLFLVLVPVIALLLTETGPWVRAGLAVVLVLTLFVAVIPMLLTASYHYAWYKLKGTVARLLFKS